MEFDNVEAKITDEMVAKSQEQVGKFRPITRQWNTEATRDGIRHWVEGIGDTNPLWIDEEYAAKSRFGTLLAPPSFVFTCNQGPWHRGAAKSKGTGMPGIHAIWGGEDWEWFGEIRRGDAIHGTTGIADQILHERSEFSGRSLESITEENFYNQRDEHIATHRMSFFRTERRTAAKRNKFAGFEKHRYTDEELRKINDDVDLEVIRGGEVRYWEDVQVGEEIPHVVKGPLTGTEMIAFLQGWGGPFLMASEITHKYLRLQPAANVPDPETNAPDFPERAHWDEAFARACGLPTGYDIGAERLSWMIHGLTNWIGDDGALGRIKVKFVALNLLGDVTWCRGTVTDKRVEDGRHLVDLDVLTINQRDQQTTEGTATIELLSKSGR
jgi:acyl dehydratase